MLQEVLRLLGADLNQKFAKIRADVQELQVRATRQLTGQIKEIGLVVGFAVLGAIAALFTLVIVFVGLYRWVEIHHGPFAALTVIGVAMAIFSALMFVLAFVRGNRKTVSATVPRGAAPLPPPPPPPLPQPVPLSLSAALPPLPPNASVFDILTHRFSTRVAGAGDEAVDAAVHVMRTGSRSALFGTLAVVALVGVLLGRRR
jgi:hypothetical protein